MCLQLSPKSSSWVVNVTKLHDLIIDDCLEVALSGGVIVAHIGKIQEDYLIKPWNVQNKKNWAEAASLQDTTAQIKIIWRPVVDMNTLLSIR